MGFHEYLNNTLGYTEYEIAQMRYFVTSILSEISKILLIGTYFFAIGKLSLFLFGAFILCILRICTGGLHFSHYIPCLLMSFFIFFAGICMLNPIPVIKPVQLMLLCICVLVNYTCAPIVSAYRPIPDGVRVHRSKRQSFWIITFYAIILFIVPENQYTDIGFWMIILQSMQLIAANIVKRRPYDENKTRTPDGESL